MDKRHETIELPAPTVWPLVFALGVALVFAGILSSAYVSMAGGVLLLVAATGWWRQVLPLESHEHVTVEAADDAAPRVVIPVEFLHAGKEKHRVRLGVKISPFSAGLKGAVVGGFAMAGVAVVFGLISQGSIWYPINLLAAAAVPSLATATVPELDQFNALGLILGIVIHSLGSILVGVLYAVMLPMFPRKAFWWAGVSAPILWSGVIASMLGFVNPALADRIDWRWFVASQLAFGLTGGFVIAQSEGIDKRQDWPLELRAGLEAPGTLLPSEEDDSWPKPSSPPGVSTPD